MPHFVPITYAVLLDQSDRDMKIPTSKNAGAHTLLEKLRERGAQTGKEPEEETEKAGGGNGGERSQLVWLLNQHASLDCCGNN